MGAAVDFENRRRRKFKAMSVAFLATFAVAASLGVATGFFPRKSGIFQYAPVHFALGHALHDLGPTIPVLNARCDLVSGTAAPADLPASKLAILRDCIVPRDISRGGCLRPRWNTCAEFSFTNFVRTHSAFRAALAEMLQDPCRLYTAEAALAFSMLPSYSDYWEIATKPYRLGYSLRTCLEGPANFEYVLYFEDREGNVVEKMKRGLGIF